ncbi:hypothetical protein IFM89_006413 [Coptis chinensis]|uniref:Uncharacterized protein n=1 Tax=Coptis chinensis TaxID=261450 RepID=A0A835LV35_9MAGN|nr:hypothetical protein IFM89_006413 [Coptis chinensis]
MGMETESDSELNGSVVAEDESLADKLNFSLKGHVKDELELDAKYKVPTDIICENEGSKNGEAGESPLKKSFQKKTKYSSPWLKAKPREASSKPSFYDQMPEPRWVISMGSCANDGGYYHYSYSLFVGRDRLCSLTFMFRVVLQNEALLYGVLQLHKKINRRKDFLHWWTK